MKKILYFSLIAIFISFTYACRSSKKSKAAKAASIQMSEKSANESDSLKNKANAYVSNPRFQNLNQALEEANNQNIHIDRTSEKEVAIYFEPTIAFASNSAEIDELSKPNLTKTATILSKYPLIEVFIEGHADSSGNQVLNKKLSQDRAKNVALYLKSQGLKTDRLAISGYGASRPLVSNETPEGRRKNRRVFIKVRTDSAPFDAN